MHVLVYFCSMVVRETLPHTICGVCSKSYNDPRILPCLHSFCQQCLHHEIMKSGSQQVFKCPTCERNINIPVGEASSLPQNLYLGFEVEVAGYMSKIVSNSEVCCDECIDGHNGPAEVFCCTCHQFLCSYCHDYHRNSRKLSKHNMVGLDKEGAKQLQATIIKPEECYCPYHEERALRLYCETCNLLVCRGCTTGDHKGHSVTELAAVAMTHRGAIEEVLTNARGIVTMLTGAIDENWKVIEQVGICKRNAHLTINQAFEILQITLEERKKALLSDLEAISLSKTTALTLQREQLEEIVDDIGRYTEAASHILQTHTDHEVVAMGGLIPTELKATLNRVQTLSLTPTQHSDISVSVQTESLLGELSKFGHVSEMSPLSSTWTSASVAKVKTNFNIKLETKNSFGEEYPHGGAQVEAEMRSKAHNEAAVYGEVEDHRDGTYTITLTPQTAGPHQLVITMDGQHVQNSPHDLDVTSELDLTLHSVKNLIYCTKRPYCIAINKKGYIYVANSGNCIDVFYSSILQRTIGRYGHNDGEFNMPCGIFIKNDILYVADCENDRIQKLTLEGACILKFYTQKPSAVIVDKENRIIVAESKNNNVCIYTHNGGLLLTIRGDVAGKNRFLYPRGLAFDPQENIHVAAYDSNTIKVFTREGVHIRTYGNPKKPSGIAIDGDGYSFVSESGGSCVSIFDPEGNKIHTVGNLNQPLGITVNSRISDIWNFTLYIANSYADTICEYSNFEL